jgi:hypothetical protein
LKKHNTNRRKKTRHFYSLAISDPKTKKPLKRENSSRAPLFVGGHTCVPKHFGAQALNLAWYRAGRASRPTLS